MAKTEAELQAEAEAAAIAGREAAESDAAAPFAPSYRRISEVIRDPSEWADLPQVDVNALEGAEIVVHDVMFLRGNVGERADMDYCIVLFAGPEVAPPSAFPRSVWGKNGIQTTMCGGAVFVRKMKQLSAYGPEWSAGESELPMLGRVIKRLGTRYPTPYYDFV